MTESKIPMRPLASSSIASYGYDEASGTLAVEFKGGRTYRYEGISPDQANGLATAKSAGRYVNELLRGRDPKPMGPGQAHERDIRRRAPRPVRTRGAR